MDLTGSKVVERIFYMPKIDSPISEKINNPIEAWQIGNLEAPEWVMDFLNKNELKLHYAGALKGFNEGLDFIFDEARVYPNGNYIVRLSKEKIIICPRKDFESIFEPVDFFYSIAKD